MGRLDGKVSVITGGTSGIGAATARLFQAEGSRVVVTGTNPATLDLARQEMQGIHVIPANASSPQESADLARYITNEYGHVDILFVNAGIALFAPIDNVEEEFFDKIFDVNVRGAYFTIKRFLPLFRSGGSIILTGSSVASRGVPNMSVYAASKAALRSLGRTLAAELAPRGIRVNTISPGPIKTPIFGKAGMSEEQLEAMRQAMATTIPLKRMGNPEEVATTALFLATQDSSFMTGAELYTDGGMVDISVIILAIKQSLERPTNSFDKLLTCWLMPRRSRVGKC